MERTHAEHDRILAVMLEKGELPEVAKRANMTLAALATWANNNADLLANLHQLLLTRAKLLAAHLELSALNALALVSSATTNTDDPRLLERALERQRKSANALLRHRTWLQRASALAPCPRERGAASARVIDATDDVGVGHDDARSTPSTSVARSAPASAPGTGIPRVPALSAPPASSVPLASSNAECPRPSASPALRTRKPPIAERLAARRLATLQSVATT